MSYAAAIDQLNAMAPELYSHPGQPRRKFSLDEVRTLLAALGNPHQRFRSVLIAGTNGKGSTAATLASILTASGARVGLYTSPHLQRINERIRIGNSEIADDVFARLYFRVHEAAQQLVQQGRLPQHPSFFEVLTAISFLCFAEEKVDLAVLEVGMGGRLDATNVVDPLLSIITDISLDHTEWLGSTIAAIAREKAGILRPGGTLIRLPQSTEADEVLREIAKQLGVRTINATAFMPSQIEQANQDKGLGAPCLSAPFLGAPGPGSPQTGLRLWGGDPSHLGTWECITPIDSQNENTSTPYTVNVLGSSVEVASPLTGDHQRRNIALAITAAVELASDFGFHITSHQIAEGIRNTVWPGRLEHIKQGRIESDGLHWILDVAHNPAGAWAVRSGLSNVPGGRKAQTLVFSCLRDKPIAEMAQILFPLFERVILTPIHSARAAAMEDLVAAAQHTETPFLVAESVADALQLASNHAGGGPIIVCGSVYLVGEARSLLLAERVGRIA
jgi:dihydrofolate synthase/folylpolyglutamate synthase